MQDQKLNNVVMQYFDSAVNLTLGDARGAASADRRRYSPNRKSFELRDASDLNDAAALQGFELGSVG